MRHLIMGTAGHIDHGKTAIIKALTQIDCDTHKLEKERGITINLGFAYLNLPTGTSVGIVDVPGHENFVNTMVAGASGVDFALLVIAADSGIMPQTIEHVKILELLKIKKIIIAINKIDLVEDDLVDLAIEEIKDFLEKTELEISDLVKVSAKTGAGIEKLAQSIERINVPRKESSEAANFRMFIDRIFTIKGFGTVVTGSVLKGSLTENDTLFLIPSNKEIRVRRIERHGKKVKRVSRGDRASLNLVGLNKSDFERGMALSKRKEKPTKLIDARLKLFPQSPHLNLWSQVVFLVGTYQSQAKVHLIDNNCLQPGNNGIVQIHLYQPVHIRTGDKFVIRSSSSDVTMGGGEIIDPHPLHHRKRPKELIDNLQRAAYGNKKELIVLELEKTIYPIPMESLSQKINVPESKIENIIEEQLREKVISKNHDQKLFLYLKSKFRKMKEIIITNIKRHHQRNPWDEKGVNFDEIRGFLQLNQTENANVLIKLLLDNLENDNVLANIENTWKMKEHKVEIDKKTEQKINYIKKIVNNSDNKIPDTEYIIARSENDLKENEIKQLLKYMTDTGILQKINGTYFNPGLIKKIKEKLLRFLQNNNNQGIKVSEFRDLIDGNRKLAILLFKYFENEKLVVRKEDRRFLTIKAKKIIN